MNTIWSQDFLQRHHLVGYAYNKSKDEAFYPQWKNQLTRNFLVKKELEKIGEDCAYESLDVCLLKGFSLLGDLYEDWGIRFASDVDLLVSFNDLWRLSDILVNNGYAKASEKKWLGNRYKFMFRKKFNDFEVCIEVHTQLFWHTRLDWEDSIKPSLTNGFYVLSPENQLVHLCGHLAFQHTFLKLFWLVDIYKFVEKNQSSINWGEFWDVAIRHGLYKSCYSALFLCQKLGLNLQPIFFRAPKKSKLSLFFLKKLLSLRFLNNPRQFPFRYFAVKWLIKDSVLDSAKYIFYWIKNKIL